MTITATTSKAAQLYGAHASRAIDACAIAALRCSGFDLMQRAAQAAFDVLLDRWPEANSVTVVCGKGNNAGDGYLVGALAQQYGLKVCVLAVVDPGTLVEDAQQALQMAHQAGVDVHAFDCADPALAADVLVDALLGTGLSAAPRAPFDEAILAINSADAAVLSIDLPSGVNADNGAVYDSAVRADVSVSFITRKVGLHTGPGTSFGGDLVFADLGVPAQAYAEPGIDYLRWAAGDLLPLDNNAYKHALGHVVIVGGDVGMPGAVVMACEAALRVGAGMVSVVSRPQHLSALIARVPEAMMLGIDDPNCRQAQLAEVLNKASVIVCGPGLGRSAWGEVLYNQVQAHQIPTVLDADGLYFLAQDLAQDHPWQGGELVLTPHAAEAGRLLGTTTDAVNLDRCNSAQELAARYGASGVLKGPGSILFSPQAPLAICAHGNPGMATAGMGDVLSGVVAGLWASRDASPSRHTSRDAAVRRGVLLHSAAADAAADEHGMRSLRATDVIAHLSGQLA